MGLFSGGLIFPAPADASAEDLAYYRFVSDRASKSIAGPIPNTYLHHAIYVVGALLASAGSGVKLHWKNLLGPRGRADPSIVSAFQHLTKRGVPLEVVVHHEVDASANEIFRIVKESGGKVYRIKAERKQSLQDIGVHRLLFTVVDDRAYRVSIPPKNGAVGGEDCPAVVDFNDLKTAGQLGAIFKTLVLASDEI